MAESLPSQGGYFDANLQQLYEDSIDQLIADLGYQVVLYLEPTVEECPNCGVGPDLKSDGVYDTGNAETLNGPKNRYFPAGARCPVCQGTHELLTEATSQYTALLKYTPEDWDMGETGISRTEVVRLKTKLSALEDVNNATKVLVEGSLFKKVADPIRTGLQTRSYLQSYWQRIDG